MGEARSSAFDFVGSANAQQFSLQVRIYAANSLELRS
jgi:hypothetical protein